MYNTFPPSQVLVQSLADPGGGGGLGVGGGLQPPPFQTRNE